MTRVIIVSDREAQRLRMACQLRAEAAMEDHSNRRSGMWRKLAERFAPTKRPKTRVRKSRK